MTRLLLTLLIPFCMACIWDRDTLGKEGEKELETAKVIVGWFDRYPDLYYEMRLKRTLAEIETSPDKPQLYDDAAVC
ncbi:hypothetical protein V2O64_21815 [Verrucomicrobiaceae bacterium 227]